MEKLSEAELYTWLFLEENQPEVRRSSITKLAEQAHVSAATIVRTLKKKGFEGFSDYKNFLKRSCLTQEMDQLSVKGLSELANRFIHKNVEEVARTISLLDAKRLNRLMACLKEANQIITIARGITAGVTDDLTHRLQTLGKKAISRYYDDMASYTAQLSAGDMVIVISLNGAEDLILNAMTKAQQAGALVLAITGDYQSPIARQSDCHLLAYKSKLGANGLLGDAESILSFELVGRIVLDLYAIYQEMGQITD